jgi:hypothetical protein
MPTIFANNPKWLPKGLVLAVTNPPLESIKRARKEIPPRAFTIPGCVGSKEEKQQWMRDKQKSKRDRK